MLVVPVVALIGDHVIHAVNAAGPEKVPLATLARDPQSWAGVPVTLGHPQKDGKRISANDPAVLERHGLGTVAKPRIEKNKLCVEALIDEARVTQLAGAAFLEALRSGEPSEVSVGCFVQTSQESGVCNGRPYRAVWQTLTPDHIAILADSRGACSIADGCGTHRAAEGAHFRATAEEPTTRSEWADEFGRRIQGFGSVQTEAPPDPYGIEAVIKRGQPSSPFETEGYELRGQPADPYQIALKKGQTR
jgi:hypothetical protein